MHTIEACPTSETNRVRYEHFFFSSRRRHTRFDCDWSSDVCSSDLDAVIILNIGLHLAVHLVLNLPLHTGIATPGKRTADFNSIDGPYHQSSGPSGA